MLTSKRSCLDQIEGLLFTPECTHSTLPTNVLQSSPSRDSSVDSIPYGHLCSGSRPVHIDRKHRDKGEACFNVTIQSQITFCSKLHNIEDLYEFEFRIQIVRDNASTFGLLFNYEDDEVSFLKYLSAFRINRRLPEQLCTQTTNYYQTRHSISIE